MVEPLTYPDPPPAPPAPLWTNPIPGESGFLALYDALVDEADPRREYVVVEIGLGIGHSIAHLLHRVVESGKPIRVVGVDPFLSTTGRNGEQQERGDAAGGDFNFFLSEFAKLDRRERERLELLRTTSVLASRLFEARSVDLVLVDGNHDYEYVADDLALWWPKVRTGGLLAGDDCCEPYGVPNAARDFVGGTSLDIRRPREGERGNPYFVVRKA